MSARPVTRSTSSTVPTGTVDLLTTTAPGARSVGDLPRRPLDVGEVGRTIVTLRGGDAQEDELGPVDRLGRRADELEGAPLRTLADQLLQTGLHDRQLARRSMASRAASRSAHTTRWPKCGRTAAVGSPT